MDFDIEFPFELTREQLAQIEGLLSDGPTRPGGVVPSSTSIQLQLSESQWNQSMSEYFSPKAVDPAGFEARRWMVTVHWETLAWSSGPVPKAKQFFSPK